MAMSLNYHHSIGVCVVLMISLSGSITAVHSQIDSCRSDLSTFIPATLNISRLNCNPIWKSFILRYYQSEDNTLSIILSSVYTSGWIAIGFSPDGLMVGSSAMVGWIDSTGKAYIKQYDLNGATQSEVVVNNGKLLETSVYPRVVLYGVNIYLAFQVKLLDHAKDQSVLFAYSTEAPNGFRLSEHDEKISLSFDFSSDGSSSSSSPSSYLYRLKVNHGALAMIGWGVILPIGAIIARYLRHKDPLWYYLHLAIQFLGYIIGLTAIIAGISLYDKLNSNFRSHKTLGISVLVLGSIQVIAFFIRPDKESTIRKYWNWYHHWLGRFALFLAAINIALGLQIGGASYSWKLVYGIILSGILISILVLEILLWAGWSGKSISPPPSF